ncbi:MAG: PEGA domain-containing protein [Planctomycetes bacterium]|nr:PEGA domain-containing protein [Planctomycetota bacterium]
MNRSILVIVLLCVSLTGCVERMISVKTTPPGAIIWLNGEEIGAAPVTISFLWYGQYEVEIRHDGYQTLKTTRNAQAPIYQWPIIDFFTECLLPFQFTDHHQWDYELTPQTIADPNALLDRAQSLRQQTEIIRIP